MYLQVHNKTFSDRILI